MANRKDPADAPSRVRAQEKLDEIFKLPEDYSCTKIRKGIFKSNTSACDGCPHNPRKDEKTETTCRDCNSVVRLSEERCPECGSLDIRREVNEALIESWSERLTDVDRIHRLSLRTDLHFAEPTCKVSSLLMELALVYDREMERRRISFF